MLKFDDAYALLGVWPESKSFSDEGYGSIPSKWKGKCQAKAGIPCNRKLIGARYYIKGYAALIGKEHVNSSMENARDYEGHGSHTISTAGGNFVRGATVFGVANGTVKGGAPRARLASYKVCWPPNKYNIFGACTDADVLKAFDRAIHDRVDVLSISLGRFRDGYFSDAISIGAFHAVKNGIAVVCSGGNNGPTYETITNISPWIFTVGASTIDRKFVTYVLLLNGERFQGSSLTKPLPEDKFYPLITAAQAKVSNATIEDACLAIYTCRMLCKRGTLDPNKVKGKILVCLGVGDEYARLERGHFASMAGAVGMILCNAKNSSSEIPSDYHLLPAAHLNYKDGLSVVAYINSTRSPSLPLSTCTDITQDRLIHQWNNPLGFITATKAELHTTRAPVMANFSSRGPNPLIPEILKPDITAPGVGIVAAFTEVRPTLGLDFDDRITPYFILRGTSMSCPHVAGVVALLKTLYPQWSSAAIKSAIMTTARTRDNRVSPIVDVMGIKANPFSYGAGHMRPNRAMDPGLVYDLTVNDYLDFLCAIGYNQTIIRKFSGGPYKCPHDAVAKANGSLSSSLLLNFNYPSITVPNITSEVTVTRRVKNVGAPGKYEARLRQPRGFLATVEPTSLTFKEIGEEQTFKLTLRAKNKKSSPPPSPSPSPYPPPNLNDYWSRYSFGELLWSDGIHYVRSPIVFSAAA
ncbi:hypothetical protein LguiB_002209 [Lonicera macranthoides]